jgi:putative intracellular protease/amidase
MRLIDRRIGEGRASSVEAFLADAVRRLAEDLEADDDQEDDLATVAEAGIADIEASSYTLVVTPGGAEALHERAMTRLRASLTGEKP